MTVLTRVEIEINEDSYYPVTATLTSDGTTPIPLANIDSIEMSLINERTGLYINSRQKQDVLNANDCTMASLTGVFTWEVKREDAAIIVPGATPYGQYENHLATLEVVWDTYKSVKQEILLKVLNLRNIPQVAP
jgi:hypothetical protein